MDCPGSRNQTALAEQPFDGREFPFAFPQAFGNKEMMIKRLRVGALQKSGPISGAAEVCAKYLPIPTSGDSHGGIRNRRKTGAGHKSRNRRSIGDPVPTSTDPIGYRRFGLAQLACRALGPGLQVYRPVRPPHSLSDQAKA
jgi:hypothetical protein